MENLLKKVTQKNSTASVEGNMTCDFKINHMESVEGNMTCDFKINELDKTSNFAYGIEKKMMSERNYQYAKNNCPYYDDGKWNENKMVCEIDDPKEKAAYEDHICDEPTANTEYPTIC